MTKFSGGYKYELSLDQRTRLFSFRITHILQVWGLLFIHSANMYSVLTIGPALNYLFHMGKYMPGRSSHKACPGELKLWKSLE